MESDDLIAHRKTDAAAPGLGGALVKLLLHIGQLRLWNAGAVVPDTDDLLRPLRCQRGVNAPPGAAMLGGVVQHIAEYLLQPLRIAADRRQKRLSRLIAQLDTLLPEQLPVGENGILKLRLQIDLL